MLLWVSCREFPTLPAIIGYQNFPLRRERYSKDDDLPCNWLHHEVMAYLQELHATVQAGAGVIHEYGVWMVFGSLFIESAGVIFAPGETFLIAAEF